MVNVLVSTPATIEPPLLIPTLDQQAAALQWSNPAAVRLLAEQALALADGDEELEGESLTILSHCCLQLVDYNAAINYGLQAVAVSKSLPTAAFLPQILGQIGHAYTLLGQYVDGLRYFIRQQQASKEQMDRRNEASAHLGRGLVYSFSGDQEKAITALDISLRIFQEVGDQVGEATALTNLCNAYKRLSDYETALYYGFQALRTSEVVGVSGIALHLIYSNIGATYIHLGNFAAAHSYLEQAMTLACAGQDRSGEMLVHLEFGRLAKAEGDYVTAIEHLQSALTAATLQGQRMFEYEAHETLAQVYQATGDFAKGLAHFQQFYLIREGVLSLQNKTRLSTLELEQEIETMRRESTFSKRLTAELERQVHERTSALRASLDRETHLAQELERALVHEAELQQLKTHIINTASHEFRTPLSIISLSMEMLCSDRADRLSLEKRLLYRNRVSEQILYLTDMLQDIFAINTSNEVVPEYAGYRFNDFCRQLEQSLIRELQQSSGITFVYPGSTTLITTDLAIVKRILFNLIVNAIKFSEPDAPIRVVCEQTTTELMIHVIDQGIGVPSDELTKIFELFYRASNVDTRRGLGLGLSIVQKLASTLEGSVSAESPGLNQGSTFHLRLPLNPVHANRVLLG